MSGGEWLAALLLGAVVVTVVAHATTTDNVDTAFSGCVWTVLVVVGVTGMIWGFSAWVAGT